MKSITIKEVKLHHTQVSLTAPFTTSFGTMQHKDVCLVEVIDESGLSGWGETVTSNEPYYNEETTSTTVYMLKEFLIPRLIHKEIDHPEKVHGMLEFVRRNNLAKAAIETTETRSRHVRRAASRGHPRPSRPVTRPRPRLLPEPGGSPSSMSHRAARVRTAESWRCTS